jgi:alkanesulfonate monooxygenase SsuD/methylene tetrahydromethanopterin reductase-like flavin-dependent oxidoreductase (luciferase family)
MKLGLVYALGADDAATGYRDALTQVRMADERGVDLVLFAEGHAAAGRATAGADAGCPAPFSLAAAVAAETTAIRLGPLDRGINLEHPVTVAEDAAVVDLISHGRVIVGVSPGADPEAYRAAGVDWDTRLDRFTESVDLVQAAWTQDAVQFVGEHVRFPLGAVGAPGWHREPAEPGDPGYVDQWRRGQVVPQHLPVLPKPHQLPHPPLWVDAVDHERVTWAARRGHGLVLGADLGDDEVARRAGWYTDAVAAAGGNLLGRELVVVRDAFVAASDDEAAELAAAAAAAGHPVDPDVAVVGSPATIVGRLRRLRSELGVTTYAFRIYGPGRSHAAALDTIDLLTAQVMTRLVA